jgi:hypothetical protein
MTLVEFLDALKQVANQDWQFYPDHGGLRDRKGKCPLCAVARKLKPRLIRPYHTFNVMSDARVALGLSEHDARIIIQAADDSFTTDPNSDWVVRAMYDTLGIDLHYESWPVSALNS